MSENKGIAGQFVIGDGIPQGIETRKPAENPSIDLSEDARELLASMSEQDLRRFIRREVHAALDDLANEIRRNVAFQPTPKRVEFKSEPPPKGICWVCEQYGENMVWYVGGPGRGTHLVHYTNECLEKAETKQETREHRG